MRWCFLVLLLLLAGCTSGRLFDGEAADKEHASYLFPEGLNVVFIRPAHADASTERQLFQVADGGVWVSGGTYFLRYACGLSADAALNDPKPNREQPLHVDPGYRFGIYCNKDGSVYLKNIGDEYVEYDSYREAGYAVAEQVRHPGAISGGDFFRYEYYNDWGSKGDIEFRIDTDYRTHLLTAQLDIYDGSVVNKAQIAYISGVRTSKEMDKQTAPKRYVADIQSCPKVQDYYAKLHSELKDRMDDPKPGSDMTISTDSPDIYRFYTGDGPNGMLSLYLRKKEDPLYQITQEAMDYVQSCGRPEDKSRF